MLQMLQEQTRREHVAPHVDELVQVQHNKVVRTDLQRDAVARLLTHGEASIEQIASDLHVSSRTRHRRLAELGLNFRILREDTRRRLAIDHPNDPRLTLAEVAWLLGYSEHSVFTCAFRRRTGESPRQSRNRQPARAASVARR